MKTILKLKKIFQRISKKYGINYSVVFGSFLFGYEFEESDLDIGIKLNQPLKFRKNWN